MAMTVFLLDDKMPFPKLRTLMNRYNVSIKELATVLGNTERTLKRKLNYLSSFRCRDIDPIVDLFAAKGEEITSNWINSVFFDSMPRRIIKVAPFYEVIYPKRYSESSFLQAIGHLHRAGIEEPTKDNFKAYWEEINKFTECILEKRTNEINTKAFPLLFACKILEEDHSAYIMMDPQECIH